MNESPGKAPRALFLRNPVWAPVGFYALAVPLLSFLRLNPTGENLLVLTLFNLVFCSSAGFLFAWLAAGSYKAGNGSSFIFFGSGMLAWGFAGAMVGPLGSANVQSAFQGIGLALSGLFMVSGALLAFAEERHRGVGHRRQSYSPLLVAYLGTAAVMPTLAWFAVCRHIPDFYIAGTGPTILGRIVTAGGILLLSVSGVLLVILSRRTRQALLVWLAFAPILMAIGRFGVGLTTPGTSLNWIARSAEYLAGVYLFIGTVSELRSLHGWKIAFREIEKRYRSLVEMSPEALLVSRGDRIVYVNPAAVRLFGAQSESQIIGRSIFRSFHADFHDSMRMRIQQLRDGVQIPLTLNRVVRLDGTGIDVEVVASSFLDAGEPAIQVLIRDISARMCAEEKVRRRSLVLAGINRIFEATIQDQSESRLGEVCLEIALGLTRGKIGLVAELKPDGTLQEIAMGPAGVVPSVKPGPPARLKPPLLSAEVIEKGRSVISNALLQCPGAAGLPPGHPGIDSFLGVPLFEEGKPVGVIAVANGDGGFHGEDQEALETLAPAVAQAFAHLRLGEQLRKKTIDLTVSNQELEAFSYSVSHDLRNPLHSILACSEVIRDDLDGRIATDAGKALGHIIRSTERMGQVIADLMLLSRVTRLELHLAAADLTSIADAIMNDLKVLDPMRKVECRITPGLIANADERLVRVMLENLLHNAWKYTSKKPAALIEVGRSDGDGEPPTFYVRDNGAGFDMGMVERLFKPFHRLHPNREYAGTGIGLTIVKRIAEKHGGAVWAQAESGRGATFFFRLG